MLMSRKVSSNLRIFLEFILVLCRNRCHLEFTDQSEIEEKE